MRCDISGIKLAFGSPIKENFFATDVVDRLELINELHPFQREVCQDTELEFSFVFMSLDTTELLYIHKGKSIEYWSMDESLFRQTMAAFRIPEIENLQVIDNLFFKTIPLVSLTPQATQTSDFMEHFMEVSKCITI